VKSSADKGLVTAGFWLALGFAIFAFVLAMVKKYWNKAKTDLGPQTKKDYVN
jgi:hypothetical protein